MKKKHNNIPEFIWSEDKREVTCCINCLGKTVTGTAKCHDNDLDMLSEKTGSEIALRRAQINVLRELRDILRIRESALNHLYHVMCRSKKFNSNSYENKTLQRQLRLIKNDLATLNESIVEEYESLREYISNKEDFYKKIRTNRERSKTNNLIK